MYCLCTILIFVIVVYSSVHARAKRPETSLQVMLLRTWTSPQSASAIVNITQSLSVLNEMLVYFSAKRGLGFRIGYLAETLLADVQSQHRSNQEQCPPALARSKQHLTDTHSHSQRGRVKRAPRPSDLRKNGLNTRRLRLHVCVCKCICVCE